MVLLEYIEVLLIHHSSAVVSISWFTETGVPLYFNTHALALGREVILILLINHQLVSLKLLIKLYPENGYRMSSIVCRVKLLTIGMIFVRPYVADFIVEIFPKASLTLACIVIAAGSFCVGNA